MKRSSAGILACSALCLVGMVSTAQAQAKKAAAPAGPFKQTAYIKASNPDANDHFGDGAALEGHGVAISGDGNTLAVGAPFEASKAKGINGDQADNSLYSAGAVYVYARKGNTWVQQAYIKASNPGTSDQFGHYVSLSQDGNTLAVSAHFEASKSKGINGDQADRSDPQAGAVYLFTRTGTTWAQQAYLKASNAGEEADGDQFGFSLALSADGKTLAVGAIAEDSNAKDVNGDQNDNSMQSAGAVYIFTRTGNTWAQQAYVKAPNTDPGDMFGYAVGLSADGNTMAVAAYDEDGGSRTIDGAFDHARRGSGAVFVFTRTGTAWARTGYLKAVSGEANDSMGYDVAISQDGNTIAAGSGDEDCMKGGINPTGCDGDMKSDTSSGAAYVFVRDTATGKWSEQAFIKSSNPGVEDWFGSRIALSGDGNTLAVGAQMENGNSKGLNGNEKDQTADDSGALYIFVRNGNTWSQQTYMKGTNTEAYDEFGGAPALNKDGKVLAVGARGESGGAKGVNADQKDNSAMGAGAVYIFNR
ncbi:MAG: integrin [Bryobacteraceae bacterium]